MSRALELAGTLERNARINEEMGRVVVGQPDEMRKAAALLRAQHEALDAAYHLARECRNPMPDPVHRKHLADRAFDLIHPIIEAKP